MSLADLATNFGPPGLEALLTIVNSTYETIRDVKVYRRRCNDLASRSQTLILSLRNGTVGLEGTRQAEFADEIELIISTIQRKVTEWASWSQLRSLLQQDSIKEGIERLSRMFDDALAKYHVESNLDSARERIQFNAEYQADMRDIRILLQTVLQDQENLRTLIAPTRDRSQPEHVEGMMATIQTVLNDPSLSPNDDEAHLLRQKLWWLHDKTDRLPPLPDLTGQVTVIEDEVVFGSSNEVVKGQWLDNQAVALRRPWDLEDNAETHSRFMKEVRIWRRLNHPHVLPLLGVISTDGLMFTVSPWMENGAIIPFLRQTPTADRVKLVIQIANGLNYLHDENVVHGDLRTENVLMTRDGIPRLADFGLSKFRKEEDDQVHERDTRCCAPELLQEDHGIGISTTFSDVYAFGMVCLEVLCGDRQLNGPPRGDKVIQRAISPGMANHQGLVKPLMELMKCCWDEVPERRPTMIQITNELEALYNASTTNTATSGSPSSLPEPTRSNSWWTMTKSRRRPSTAQSDSTVAPLSPISPLTTSPHPESSVPRAIVKPPRLETPPVTITSRQLDRKVILSNGGGYSPVSSNTPIAAERLSSSPSQGSLSRRAFNGDTPSRTALLSPTTSGSPPRLPPLMVHQGSSSTISTSLTPSFGSQAQSGPSSSTTRPSTSRSTRSDATTTSSSGSVSYTSPIVRDAIASRSRIVKETASGEVQAGTLEGLVDRIIKNVEHFSRRDAEFRRTFLIACSDITTPEALFQVIKRRFEELTSDASIDNQLRIGWQLRILGFLQRWLQDFPFFVNHELLWEIRTFRDTAFRLTAAGPTMTDMIDDLGVLMDRRKATLDFNPALNTRPHGNVMDPAVVTPRDVGIGLTLLEGDKYSALTISDYVAHIKDPTLPSKVKEVYGTNNRIVDWVKETVLGYDDTKGRAGAIEFFIKTAEHCRKRRNFASLVAIATALHSPEINELQYTKSELKAASQEKLAALEAITDPTANHRSYRRALTSCSYHDQAFAVPWLAVHLKDLNAVFRANPIIVKDDNHAPLINFQRYARFSDRVNEVLYYEPPKLEHYREDGQLGYIQRQLASIDDPDTMARKQQQRSSVLKAKERRDYLFRTTQLTKLGFSVDVSRKRRS